MFVLKLRGRSYQVDLVYLEATRGWSYQVDLVHILKLQEDCLGQVNSICLGAIQEFGHIRWIWFILKLEEVVCAK